MSLCAIFGINYSKTENSKNSVFKYLIVRETENKQQPDNGWKRWNGAAHPNH